jgi:hypothetical protein
LKILNPNKDIFINKNVSIRENFSFIKALNELNESDINCYFGLEKLLLPALLFTFYFIITYQWPDSLRHWCRVPSCLFYLQTKIWKMLKTKIREKWNTHMPKVLRLQLVCVKQRHSDSVWGFLKTISHSLVEAFHCSVSVQYRRFWLFVDILVLLRNGGFCNGCFTKWCLNNSTNVYHKRWK